MAVNESKFSMWRTLFAMAHADNIVTEEEIHFMVEALERVDFSPEQKSVLEEDVKTPQDIEAMFKGVTDAEDRAEFFKFARELVWCDGDFGEEEQAVMIKLKQAHMRETNIDDMVGNVKLELEEELPSYEDVELDGRHKFSFRERFLQLISKH